MQHGKVSAHVAPIAVTEAVSLPPPGRPPPWWNPMTRDTLWFTLSLSWLAVMIGAMTFFAFG